MNRLAARNHGVNAMKYAVVIMSSAFLGGMTGLLSAWGAAAHSSAIINPDPRPGWFVSMPVWGAVGGLAVGLIAVVVSRFITHSAAEKPNKALHTEPRAARL